jgi:hypothetical protein
MTFQGIVELRDGGMFAFGVRRKASGISVSIE